MVQRSVLNWVSGSLTRQCAGLVVVSLCALPVASAQSPEETAGLSLKLDWDLVPEAGTPGVSRDELLDAEAPELRERILKVRDQVASLEKANAEKSAYLNQHEALIQRMRGAVAAQEEVIARLSADTGPPQPAAVAQGAATAPRVSALARPIHLGPIELPGMVRNYLTEGAFAAVLVILLGWVLYLRSVAKARSAELTIMRGGRSARPSPAAVADGPAPGGEWPEPGGEWPEPEPAPVAGRESAPAVSNTPSLEVPAAAPAPTGTDEDTAPELAFSDGTASEKTPNSGALAEVDTLIADGNLNKAKQMLDELAKGDELNPEFRLRLLHVDSELGNSARETEQEQILAEMSEGSLSETRNRIKEIGRGLMPGHPLFDDDAKLEEAKRIFSSHQSQRPDSGGTEEPETKPKTSLADPAQRSEPPPLVLDLDVDHEAADFLNDINFDTEKDAGGKG